MEQKISSELVGDLAFTGGCAIVERLRAHDVRHIFGMPGVHNFELYRGIAHSGIKHISVRHEQGAGFMADGYARASGLPGVAVTISGPGVSNIATALGQAWSDSVPVLHLASSLARADQGRVRGKIHEVPDQLALIRGVTASASCPLEIIGALEAIDRAFIGFAHSRPRPIHISIPMDILEASATSDSSFKPMKAFPSMPAASACEEAANLLALAKQPIIIAGGGALGAQIPLKLLCESIGAPVVTTIAGKGLLPISHRLSLGATLSRPEILEYILSADLVLAVGTELSEADFYTCNYMATGGETFINPDLLPLSGLMIRIDIDAQVAAADYRPALVLVGDANATLELIVRQLPAVAPKLDISFQGLRASALVPRSKIERAHATALAILARYVPEDAVVAGDMCQLSYSACIYFQSSIPRRFLFPAGFGTLGYAVPAAIGASIALNGVCAVALVGDCGLMFTIAELASAVEQSIPLIIVLWNNQCLAEIRDGMLKRGVPPIGVIPHNPDFQALARSFGAASGLARTSEELGLLLIAAIDRKGPTLIEIKEADALSWQHPIDFCSETERARGDQALHA